MRNVYKVFLAIMSIPFMSLGPGAGAWAASAQQFLNTPGPFYQDIGYLGMGGAGVATTQDANSVFYNPAGLAEIQRDTFAILNVQAGGSLSLMQASAYNNIGEPTSGLLQTVQSSNNTLVGIGGSDYSYFATHDFAVGVLADLAGTALPNVPVSVSSTTPLGSIAARGDVGVVIGGGYTFFNDALDVGGALFALNQYYYANRSVTENNSTSISPGNMGNGFGVMANLGAIYHIIATDSIDWTGGVSEQSLGQASFGLGGSLPEETNAGTGLVYKTGYGTLTADADYDDAFNQTGFPAIYHVFAGINYKLPDVFGFSVGVFQGQPTFGLDFNLWAVRIQAAEWTMAAYQTLPANQMVGVQVGLGWF